MTYLRRITTACFLLLIALLSISFYWAMHEDVFALSSHRKASLAVFSIMNDDPYCAQPDAGIISNPWPHNVLGTASISWHQLFPELWTARETARRQSFVRSTSVPFAPSHARSKAAISSSHQVRSHNLGSRVAPSKKKTSKCSKSSIALSPPISNTS